MYKFIIYVDKWFEEQMCSTRDTGLLIKENLTINHHLDDSIGFE